MVAWTNTRDEGTRALRVLIHGTAGVGKTRLAATVPDPSRCLIALVEDGALSLCDIEMPAVRITCARDMREVCRVLQSPDGERIDVFYIDSLTAFAEMVLFEEKAQTRDPRKAFGVMQDTINEFLVGVMPQLPQHVFATAKQELIQTDEGDRWVPNFPGQTLVKKSPVSHAFDACWAMHCDVDADGNAKRWLQTQLHANPKFSAKTRDPLGRIGAREEPNLASIISRLCPPKQPENK